MADYVGLAIAVGQIISSLIEVINDTKDASKEIQDMRRELLTGLYTIKGSLDYFPDESRQMLQSAGLLQVAYNEMMTMMEKDVRAGSSTFERMSQYATWHWDKKRLQDHMRRIERIKSWFLVATTSNITSSMDQFSESLESLKVIVEKDFEAKSKDFEQSSRRKALRYLTPFSPERTHEIALSRHQHGTSSWFIQGQLQEFIQASHWCGSILWLKGKSGSGKTTLLAQSAQHLQNTLLEAEVLFWYCTFDNLDSQQPRNFLGWIIGRLAHKIPELLDPLITQMRDAEQKHKQPKYHKDQLEELLFKNCALLPLTVIVFDAINECTLQTEMERLFYRMARYCPRVRVVVSSTGDPSISVPRNTPFRTIRMSESDVNNDIDVHIKHVLQNDRILSKLSRDLKNDIHQKIQSKSDGMFRYAHCVMDQLSGKGSPLKIRRALDDLPFDLNAIYARILENLVDDREVFKEALRWLCFSQKPLELNELAELVVIENGTRQIDDEMRLLDPKRTLVEQSNGLVVYDPETSIVSLGHSTVKTFLMSDTILHAHNISGFKIGAQSDNHHRILRLFMTYLSFSDFEYGYGSIERTTLERYRAINYVSGYWPDFVEVESKYDWNLISDFFKTQSAKNAGIYGSWLQIMKIPGPLEVVQETHPLYYAAALGYTSLAKAILHHDPNVNLETPGGRLGRTVLQMACFTSQKEIAHFLIQAGADPMALDKSAGRNAVWWAQQNGWGDILELIAAKRETHDSIMPLPEAYEASRRRYSATRNRDPSKDGPYFVPRDKT